MEKLLMFLVICVFVKAVENRHHPKLVRAYEEYERSEPAEPDLEKGRTCVVGDEERHTLTEESKCGAPKKLLYDLAHMPKAAHEEIFPKAVWLKHCVGLCDHEGTDSKCLPTKKVQRQIPIKKLNILTSKESCSEFTLEEHEACECSSVASSKTGHTYVKSIMNVF